MNKNDIKIILETEDPVILEIGANNGSDTQQFLDTFEQGLFFCFEPDPRAFKKLDKITDNRCKKYNYAISNNDGQAKFNQSSGRPPGPEYDGVDWDYSGSLRKPKNHVPLHPWCKFDNQIVVQTMRLDTWIEAFDIEIIDFIHCDVQGCECDVIAGGQKTLIDKVKWVFMEYSNEELYEGEKNLEELLKMLPGYELYKDYGTDFLACNTRFV